MGIYAYCVVCPGLDPPAGLRGVSREAIHHVRTAGLDLWVGSQDAAPAPSVEAMRAHNEVVTRALALGETPLPFRFGQWLEDETALNAALAPRAGELERALRRVRGAVEYGIRVLDPAAADEPSGGASAAAPATGAEYLRRLASRLGGSSERKALRDAVAVALRKAAGADLIGWSESAQETAHGVLAVSHLVPRSGAEGYLERVRSVRSSFPELRFLFSGPWPPYSFGPERGAA